MDGWATWQVQQGGEAAAALEQARSAREEALQEAQAARALAAELQVLQYRVPQPRPN